MPITIDRLWQRCSDEIADMPRNFSIIGQVPPMGVSMFALQLDEVVPEELVSLRQVGLALFRLILGDWGGYSKSPRRPAGRGSVTRSRLPFSKV